MQFFDKIKNFYINNKQKVLFFGGIAFVMLLIIITIAVVVKIITSKVTYEDLEEKMNFATRTYLAEHPEAKPTSSNPTVVIEASTLIEGKYLKKLTKYVKDSTCTGNVYVDYIGDDNLKYQSYLVCKNYKTEKLVTVLKKNNSVASTGDGLHEMNNEFVYRGQNPNNYLKFNDELWRIIKIDKDNKIKIILTETKEKNKLYGKFDDRYNTERDNQYGINNFALSRVYVNLQDIYKNRYSKYQNLLTKYDLCYGKRSADSGNKDGTLECNDVLKNQDIGLIPLYDYMNASLDTLCATPNNKECQNYNYLVDKDPWWTMTADVKSTFNVYYVHYSGKIESEFASSNRLMRYVLALDADVLYKSGNGTKEDPYIVR